MDIEKLITDILDAHTKTVVALAKDKVDDEFEFNEEFSKRLRKMLEKVV